MDFLELEEEAELKIAESKTAEIQLTGDIPESIEENELQDTLSQLSAASRGAESQRVTYWVHNGSVVENSNQGQLNIGDVDPSACSSVHPAPTDISLQVNPEGVLSMMLIPMT